MTALSNVVIVPKDLINSVVPFKSQKTGRYVEMTRQYRSVSSYVPFFEYQCDVTMNHN